MSPDAMPQGRRRPDPPAQRGQPRRTGADSWTTSPRLIRALVENVLPVLPPGPVWEPACGTGALATAIRIADRRVIASDRFPRDDAVPLDFVDDAAPASTAGTIVISNPPFNALDSFITRGLDLLDSGHVRGLVLLLRHDHLMSAKRVAALNRASWQVHMNWRPRWIAGTAGHPRWSFCWVTWAAGPRRAPLYVTARTAGAP
jgi:hypothetical protein